jgi:plastocyanin
MLPRLSLPTLAAAAASALLIGPAAADAATKTVYAGAPAAKAAALPEGAIGNAFFPRRATVAAGGKVAFRIGGLHNVVFAAKGAAPGPFHAPDPARPVAGVTDPAGAAAWFNGRPGWFIDPAHVIPAGDAVVDGKELDGSGIFAGEGAPPDYVATFPKAGTYRYLCTVHPGMKGTVRVLPRGAEVASRGQDAKAVARQVAATVKSARRLAAEVPAAGVVRAGNDRGAVAFLRFFPGTRQVAAGESVRFEVSAGTTEIHNVVFGPEDFLARTAAAFISPGAQGIAYDPVSVYASDPGELRHDGANHGNGFVSTGLLDADPRTALPRSRSVTFTRPGSYRFICTVHGPSMAGTIEVES